jgi:hypothetical protein
MCNDFDIDWFDIAIAGALSEEIANEEIEKIYIEKDIEPDELD